MESIKNFLTEGQVTASTSNFQMTDEQIMSEVSKYTDRAAVAVYRSEHATVIVSQLFLVDVTTGYPINPYKEGFIPDVGSDGMPEG